MRRPAWRSAAGAVVAAALALILRRLGSGSLAAPPWKSVDAVSDWVADVGPASTALSVLRFAAEIAAWYLVIVAVAHLVATVTRAALLLDLADVLRRPLPRRVARLAVGVSLATAATPTALSSDEIAPPATTELAAAGPAEGSDLASARPIVPVAYAIGGPVQTRSAEPAVGPSAEPRVDTWTVTEGDSFWLIARDTVAAALHRPPDVAEVAPYWREVVDANRHRLVDVDDPDLILPGQRFELPVYVA